MYLSGSASELSSIWTWLLNTSASQVKSPMSLRGLGVSRFMCLSRLGLAPLKPNFLQLYEASCLGFMRRAELYLKPFKSHCLWLLSNQPSVFWEIFLQKFQNSHWWSQWKYQASRETRARRDNQNFSPYW